MIVTAVLLLAAQVTASAGVTQLAIRVVEPPPDSVVGGSLLEFLVRAEDPPAEWTMCVRPSEGANTSCVLCNATECHVDATTREVGIVEPHFWAADGVLSTVPDLRALLAAPPSSTMRVGVLLPTPLEVFRLGVNALWQRPFETSRAWWGRSTAPALRDAAVAASEAQVLDTPLPRGPFAVPPAPPLNLATHEAFLGPTLPQTPQHTWSATTPGIDTDATAEARGEGQRVLIAVAAGERGAPVADAALDALWRTLRDGRGVDIVLFAYDDTDWRTVSQAGSNKRRQQQQQHESGAEQGRENDESLTWESDATVIRRRGHMKWWYVKRFLTPQLANPHAYGWVVVLDEDVLLTDPSGSASSATFNVSSFLDQLQRHGALLGQPSHLVELQPKQAESETSSSSPSNEPASTTFDFLKQPSGVRVAGEEGERWHGGNTVAGVGVPPVRLGRGEEARSQRGNDDATATGEEAEAASSSSAGLQEAADSAAPAEVLWTTMVECGPLTAFHASVWPCVWSLLQSDLTSGFGYDLVWASRCARSERDIARRTGPGLRAAVSLTHAVAHADLRTASSVRRGFFRRAVGEGLVLFERLRREAARQREGQPGASTAGAGAGGGAAVSETVLAQQDGSVVADEVASVEDGTAADTAIAAISRLERALEEDEMAGVLPMEPRVIGVGRQALV